MLRWLVIFASADGFLFTLPDMLHLLFLVLGNLQLNAMAGAPDAPILDLSML